MGPTDGWAWRSPPREAWRGACHRRGSGSEAPNGWHWGVARRLPAILVVLSTEPRRSTTKRIWWSSSRGFLSRRAGGPDGRRPRRSPSSTILADLFQAQAQSPNDVVAPVFPKKTSTRSSAGSSSGHRDCAMSEVGRHAPVRLGSSSNSSTSHSGLSRGGGSIWADADPGTPPPPRDHRLPRRPRHEGGTSQTASR